MTTDNPDLKRLPPLRDRTFLGVPLSQAAAYRNKMAGSLTAYYVDEDPVAYTPVFRKLKEMRDALVGDYLSGDQKTRAIYNTAEYFMGRMLTRSMGASLYQQLYATPDDGLTERLHTAYAYSSELQDAVQQFKAREREYRMTSNGRSSIFWRAREAVRIQKEIDAWQTRLECVS